MNAPQQPNSDNPIAEALQATLDAQRADYLAEGEVSAEVRLDRIDRCIAALIKYQDQIHQALNTDFTCRPREVTLLTDVVGSIGTAPRSSMPSSSSTDSAGRSTTMTGARPTATMSKCQPRRD